jgi:DNA polymerase-3 subunit gamma/tau
MHLSELILPSMSDSEKPVETNATMGPAAESDSQYTVVARRYRPKDFSELVGQQTIVQALTTAIQTNRVGHAYLFTGARGVGKTSSARIFAKALNASADGSGSFDANSDIAQAIDAGEDMDVLEIDGASNRGIDEIRQLRANVAVRPSRSPYKIYISFAPRIRKKFRSRFSRVASVSILHQSKPIRSWNA